MIPDARPDTDPRHYTAAELDQLPAGSRLYRWDARAGTVLHLVRGREAWELEGKTIPAQAIHAFAPVPAPCPLLALPVNRTGGTSWEVFEARQAGPGSWTLELLEPFAQDSRGGPARELPGRLERQADGSLAWFARTDAQRMNPRPVAEVPAWAVATVPDHLEALGVSTAWRLGNLDRASAPQPPDPERQGQDWWIGQTSHPDELADPMAWIGFEATRNAYLLGLYGFPNPELGEVA